MNTGTQIRTHILAMGHSAAIKQRHANLTSVLQQPWQRKLNEQMTSLPIRFDPYTFSGTGKVWKPHGSILFDYGFMLNHIDSFHNNIPCVFKVFNNFSVHQSETFPTWLISSCVLARKWFLLPPDPHSVQSISFACQASVNAHQCVVMSVSHS